MKHSESRELSALDLYDELDPHERERLEAHLAGCADCRAFAARLRSGLGAARPPEDAFGPPPAEWLAELRAGMRAMARPRARLRGWLAAMAGFAAGVLVTSLVAAGPRQREAEVEGSRFAVQELPPKAAARGSLAQLGVLLGR